jgi:ribosome-binding factor A
MVTRRQRKVADLIHEELSTALMRRVSDPRLAGVTVTAVEVSADLEHATIFYGVLGDEEERLTAAQAGLEHARGFLRRILAESLGLRQAPDLHFRLDRSLAQGARIEALIRSLHDAGEGQAGSEQDEP